MRDARGAAGLSQSDPVLAEQIAYYRARAGEYDEWFLRQGRYDQGPELNRQRFAEVAEVQAVLERHAPYGRVLELACGTGWWTEQLAHHAERIMAVDASPEVIEINRQRVQRAKVTYDIADLFAWKPRERYDLVFFSFWLSHVPSERFAPFWELVRAALVPGGRVFFIDSRYAQTSTARDQPLEGIHAVTLQRRLNDGREFRIVKVFYAPDELSHRLHSVGWDIQIATTSSYFLYGTGTLSR
jgi:demethylmenaquinone methyltransferase/2-methoxy-6-polyprenyl-1,4-benzoquinol methylase